MHSAGVGTAGFDKAVKDSVVALPEPGGLAPCDPRRRSAAEDVVKERRSLSFLSESGGDWSTRGIGRRSAGGSPRLRRVRTVSNG
jgi:hypothetical protein|eukprot:COSAG06_NODE_164_length_21596_cov_37.740500_26_plen_85_part_00